MSRHVVPNTILRSRLLGKVILRPFPSPLPANTILDCILDENWRSNGILHVLDVVRWKGQDVGGCEASFRLVDSFLRFATTEFTITDFGGGILDYRRYRHGPLPGYTRYPLSMDMYHLNKTRGGIMYFLTLPPLSQCRM